VRYLLSVPGRRLKKLALLMMLGVGGHGKRLGY
jgi:hypothetical protein